MIVINGIDMRINDTLRKNHQGNHNSNDNMRRCITDSDNNNNKEQQTNENGIGSCTDEKAPEAILVN